MGKNNYIIFRYICIVFIFVVLLYFSIFYKGNNIDNFRVGQENIKNDVCKDKKETPSFLSYKLIPFDFSWKDQYSLTKTDNYINPDFNQNYIC